jgi:hypothetical protein
MAIQQNHERKVEGKPPSHMDPGKGEQPIPSNERMSFERIIE